VIRRSGLLLALSFAGFVSLGLPDGLLGVAWPSIRVSFDLPIDALGPLLLVWTAGFVLASFGIGRLLARFGTAPLLAIGFLSIASALVGYSVAPRWGVMIAFGALAGLGAGVIDASLNTHVAAQHGARALNWMHACWGVGAASGPALMARLLAAGHAWQLGYRAVGVWQLAPAVCFAATRASWPPARPSPRSGGSQTPGLARTLGLAPAWLGIAAFFLYTGVESSAGTWVFSLFTQARGMPPRTAGTWVSGYWACLALGRLIFGWIAGRTSVAGWLRPCIAGIAGGAGLVALGGSGAAGGLGLALLGLCCGPIYPSLIASTRSRVGEEHAANAVGFQVAAAALGQSLLPAALGVLAARVGLEVVGPALLAGALALFAAHERLAARRGEIP
jgi:fucose permease